MKSLIVFLLIVFSVISVYPQQFHSLDGIESPNGQTILIYRLGSDQFQYNPVHKFNLATGYEQKIMDAHSIIYPVGADIKSINDFEFFPNDEDNFMNVGDQIYMDYGSYIAKNDSIVFDHYSPFYNVDISKQNPQKVFVFGGGGPVRSWDGGLTFPLDSIHAVANFIPITLANFDDNVLFGINEEQQLSKNGIVVDTSMVSFGQYSKFLFDVNQLHVYRVNWTYGGYSLNVSNNKGNAFTWIKTFQAENPFYVAIDSAQSGVVYLADGRNIYKSVNNGYDFVLYKSLPSKLVGIYKKPNSEVIYAASKSMIFKITPDSTTIIKSLPIQQELFTFYPLSIGNFWKYKVEIWDSWPIISYSEDTFSRRVISKETKSNNKEYFKIEEKYYNSPYTSYVYERVDTATGKIYKFDNECTNPDSEKVIDDLTAEIGDSLLIQRFTPCWDSILTFFSYEDNQIVFNEYRNTKQFDYSWLMGYSYKLSKGIGIAGIVNGYDFGHTDFIIKGCVINGMVYGDTTFVVDVEEEPNPIPKEFKLEQNYPNPFNPSTKISWQTPVGSWQTLKVYDVLGNEVATLVNEYRNAGSYEVEFSPEASIKNPASGVYFYQLKAGGFIQTKKMLMMK